MSDTDVRTRPVASRPQRLRDLARDARRGGSAVTVARSVDVDTLARLVLAGTDTVIVELVETRSTRPEPADRRGATTTARRAVRVLAVENPLTPRSRRWLVGTGPGLAHPGALADAAFSAAWAEGPHGRGAVLLVEQIEAP